MDNSASIQATATAGKAGETYTLYKRRWFMLAIFSIAGLLSSLFQMSFAAIQDIVINFFKVSALDVNMLSMLFMIMYIPMAVVAAWLLKSYGLRVSVLVGTIVTTVGAWLRYWGAMQGQDGPAYFWVLFVGQLLAAAGQPFIVNAITLMAGSWFGETERAIATTIGAFTNILGSGVAFAMAPGLVNEGSDIAGFMLILAGVSSGVTLLAIVVFRSRPPTPPSKSAASIETLVKEEGFFDHVKALFTNINYMKIFFAFGLGFGAIQALATLVNQIFLPEGFNADEAGYFGAALIGAGLVGAFVFGGLADFTRRYYPLLAVASVMALGSIVAITVLMQVKILSYTLAIICMCGLGCFAVGLVPICLELGVEVTYPISESQSTGFIYLAGNVFSIACTLIASALQDSAPPYRMVNSMWFLTGIMGVCIIVALAFNGRYLRLEHERGGGLYTKLG